MKKEYWFLLGLGALGIAVALFFLKPPAPPTPPTPPPGEGEPPGARIEIEVT